MSTISPLSFALSFVCIDMSHVTLFHREQVRNIVHLFLTNN